MSLIKITSYGNAKRLQREHSGFALRLCAVPATYAYTDDAGVVEDILAGFMTRDDARAIVAQNNGETIDATPQ